MTAGIVESAATWLMTGVVWYVQLVHYPSFRAVERERFVEFHRHHTAATTLIVGPAMVVEAACAVYRAWAGGGWRGWAGLALVAILWAGTFFVMVPLHNRLGRGFDETAAARLIRWNWLRTAAWTLRGLLLLTA
jgi:hypothetical protein